VWSARDAIKNECVGSEEYCFWDLNANEESLKTFEESDEIGGKKWGILKMKANV
jgi:hypothetical protein